MAHQKDSGSDQNFDYMFKLLIIGNSSVGKTSFLFRYCDDSFTSAFVSTVGIDFKVTKENIRQLTHLFHAQFQVKTVFRGEKRVKLQIWVGLKNFSVVPLSQLDFYSGHSRSGTLSNDHYRLLSRCDGLYTHV